MSSSIPLQIAETIQTAHIVHDPSVERDMAPSTAADTREPVVVDAESQRKLRHQAEKAHALDEDPLELEPLDDEDEDDEDGPYSVIRPWDPATDKGNHYGLAGHGSQRPHQQLPPLPDLRFEQSYLRSIAAADTWWKVGLITIRDQMLMPFTQGLLYNLAVCGWQYWNRSAKLSGQSLGARVRRWWWGVNNWTIPGTAALTAAASPVRPPPVRRN
ncbi:hypothetical protein SBRCBS47491_006091 [Sporothrix bragantina]|uniref:Duf1770 domain containing protein n=1 Tax=Sporothrix bragantina TaxID=671064 RepID=A0ABP0C471_9PEZI